MDQAQIQQDSASVLVPNPAVNDVVSLEVTELLDKITSLESKLDAMDVKFEEIATEARKKLPVSFGFRSHRCRPPSQSLMKKLRL